jgi:hypothetical protein
MGGNVWNRLCPLDDIEKGRIDIAPEEWIPDGSNGPTFTDDAGTDGTMQFNRLQFNGAADVICYHSFYVPADYTSGAKLKLLWYTTSTMNTTTTAVYWSTYVRSVTVGTDATGLDEAGTICTGVEALCLLPNAARVRELTVDLESASVEIDPGDFLQLTLKRDVSQDANVNFVYLVGSEFQYVKG